MSSIRFTSRDPRRNLPKASSQRRGESNFLVAFEQHFTRRKKTIGVGGRYFEVNGYGIADFLWIEVMPHRGKYKSEAEAAAQVVAFELKLKGWKQALTQAYRYSYFADKAIVVLPPSSRDIVRSKIETFRRLRIGAWIFDQKRDKIERIYTPSRALPRSHRAKRKALALLSRRLKFRQLFE